jgi:hypothetical protein
MKKESGVIEYHPHQRRQQRFYMPQAERPSITTRYAFQGRFSLYTHVL